MWRRSWIHKGLFLGGCRNLMQCTHSTTSSAGGPHSPSPGTFASSLGQGPHHPTSGCNGFLPPLQRPAAFLPLALLCKSVISVWKLSHFFDTWWTPTFEAGVSNSPWKPSLTTSKPHTPLASCTYPFCDTYQMLFYYNLLMNWLTLSPGHCVLILVGIVIT